MIVVGGGPVGLATACAAARHGAEVVVLERARSWPVDKACGEGLMPPAVRWLERMQLEPAGARFAGIRYVDGDLVAEGRFPDGPGLGVRRTELSRVLHKRATKLGVELVTGAEVSEIEDGASVRVKTSAGNFTANWLVGADGLHSRVRSLGGFRTKQGRPRFGLRRHFRVEQPPALVEVHWADGVEAYLTPVGPDQVGLALLRGDGKASFDELLARFPGLAARLGPPLDEVRGAGPFALSVDRPLRGRVLLVGDAAGYLDAITGEGLALGWRGGELAVRLALDGRAEEWPAVHGAIKERHLVFTHLLLAISRRPALRRRVVRALAAAPEAFSTLLGFNTGHVGWGVLPALARVGLGLLRS